METKEWTPPKSAAEFTARHWVEEDQDGIFAKIESACLVVERRYGERFDVDAELRHFERKTFHFNEASTSKVKSAFGMWELDNDESHKIDLLVEDLLGLLRVLVIDSMRLEVGVAG